MSLETYLLSVVRGERKSFEAGIVRITLALLAHVYVAGLKLFFLPYRLGIRKQARLSVPVISVGNLTVGGTGKTSMVQWLCEQLRSAEIKVVVLNRGYRGGNEHGVAIVSDERRVLLKADEAGDEAHMLASMLPGVPVVVGKDRRESGKLAIEAFSPDLIVLDDGMQFYQLYRDVEITLLDATQPFDNGWTFPRGLLREPKTHLRRASVVVVTNSASVSDARLQEIRSEATKLAPHAQLFCSSYGPELFRALDRSGNQPPDWLAGRKVATFCALGNPSNFEEAVVRLGATIAHSTRLPDHQTPTMGDLETCIEKACEAGAEAVIVSEKDAVKLPPLGRPLKFYALIVRQQPDRPDDLLGNILRGVQR